MRTLLFGVPCSHAVVGPVGRDESPPYQSAILAFIRICFIHVERSGIHGHAGVFMTT